MPSLNIPALALVLAGASMVGQPNLAVTYSSPATVTLNEPLVINLTMHNLLPEPVNVDLGWNRREHFSVTVRAPDGMVYRPRIVPQDMGRVGRFVIPPNGTLEQPLVLDDWLPLDREGNYKIEIRFTGPASARGKAIDAPPGEVVDVHVGPRNPTLLQAKCEELRQNVRHANQTSGMRPYTSLATPAIPSLSRAFGRPWTRRTMRIW